MKKLIAVLIPLILLYAAWYYWQIYADRPLQTNLLNIAAAAVTEVTVYPPEKETPLGFQRVDERWVVTRGPRQILDQTVRVENFIGRLVALRTDSVSRAKALPDGYRITVRTEEEDYDLVLGLANGAPQALVPATGDVYHLPPATARYILPALEFDYYREAKLLNVLPGQVDSIVASRNDSVLWAESASPTPLAQHLLAPAAAPFADYFDEIAHRDRYFADLDFYFSGHPHRVRVYQDSLWPQPYVLVGNDYPRRFLGFSKITD